ncbi:MAG: heme exporter protein CcmB [Deltaproteobacteria bacterium]
MWQIARKDLLIEWRTGEILASMLLLSVLIVLVFAFTLEPSRLHGPAILGGLLWATLLFSGTVALNRSFLLEREGGAWTALALAPLDRGSIFLGKMLANLVLLLLGAAVLLPLMMLLLGTKDLAPNALLPASLVLGMIGFAAIGTLFAAMASRTRAREVLMPLLTFPLLAPLLIAAARTTTAGLIGEPLSAVRSWLLLLVAFDLVFTVAGWLFFDHVLED